jgi:phosphate transport system protein
MAIITHTSSVYEHELCALRDALHGMGRVVEDRLAKEAAALRTRDTHLAPSAVGTADQLDRLQREIEELVVRITVKRQPVASDLRFVTTALKIVSDLGCIGQSCLDMGELLRGPALPLADDLAQLADRTLSLVRDALGALETRDADKARALLGGGAVIAEHGGHILSQAITVMARDPGVIRAATRAEAIVTCLERMAEHAVNVAAGVVFMIEGRRGAAARTSRSPWLFATSPSAQGDGDVLPRSCRAPL